jgi:2-methylisocitrate lyase-like PEP mutase family enzyme
VKNVTAARERFRKRLSQKPIVVAPGAADALVARLVERAGFEAIYISGYCVEGTYGFPDVGLLGMSEVIARAKVIVDSVDIPVICDSDTGYGGIFNVVRTVQEFEKAGVAAIQIEDQMLPKKCGSAEGKRLVQPSEMIAKLKAAIDARTDPNFMIIARTDAVAVEGFEAAMRRMHLYAEAGADMVMVLGPYTRDHVVRMAKEAPVPLMYLNSETFTMPMLPTKELDEIGVPIVAFTASTTLSAARAVEKTLEVIKEKGTTVGLIPDAMVSIEHFNEIVGMPAFSERERKYVFEAVK